MVVTSYNPEWPRLYREERSLLCAILGTSILRIHHIGSTAIPGMCAKPIIDMLGETQGLALVDALSPELQKAGYAAKGENGIPGRRYFRKGNPLLHTHHLHVFGVGDANIERHLAFRDYLRSHARVAKSYCELKQELAVEFEYDPAGYQEGKSELASALEAQALRWYRRTGRSARAVQSADGSPQ